MKFDVYKFVRVRPEYLNSPKRLIFARTIEAASTGTAAVEAMFSLGTSELMLTEHDPRCDDSHRPPTP